MSLLNVEKQVEMLEDRSGFKMDIPSFTEKLLQEGMSEFKPTSFDTLQINVGKLCNQACKHCHVEAGPKRTEIMGREVMNHCIDVIKKHKVKTVDITGGAPEMNPNFRWFVESCQKLGVKIIVRCNLTIIFETEGYADLPEFFAKNKVEVVSSLPFYEESRTDSVRGKGVFDKSIKALQLLNKQGYGQENSGLELHLVYNPSGAFLPASQEMLQKEYKKILADKYGINFNQLFTITNMPINRFLKYLIRSDNYHSYMETLVTSFNLTAAKGAMCRDMVSVSWDGYLFDCDFNQMLDMPIENNGRAHISKFDINNVMNRDIIVSQHCYGCTAGDGSSCGGATA